MLDFYREMITRQYEAALCMLGKAIDQCPAPLWHEPVAMLRFSQAAFHALFFTDLYLGRDIESLRDQEFHRNHAATFADYEELEPRRQQALYEKEFVVTYLHHCREKASEVVAAESEETLRQPAGFDWLKFPRGELHVYNIRHIHHHAAQLSLRLQLDTGSGVAWVGSGWRTA